MCLYLWWCWFLIQEAKAWPVFYHWYHSSHRLRLVGSFSAEGRKAFKSSIPKFKQWNKKSPVASTLYRQQFMKLQKCMKVSNAASPPQLEFPTHRSYCPSEMSKGGLLRISSSFWVSMAWQHPRKSLKSAKQKAILFFQTKQSHKEKRKKSFHHVKRVVRDNFYCDAISAQLYPLCF